MQKHLVSSSLVPTRHAAGMVPFSGIAAMSVGGRTHVGMRLKRKQPSTRSLLRISYDSQPHLTLSAANNNTSPRAREQRVTLTSLPNSVPKYVDPSQKVAHACHDNGGETPRQKNKAWRRRGRRVTAECKGVILSAVTMLSLIEQVKESEPLRCNSDAMARKVSSSKRKETQ